MASSSDILRVRGRETLVGHLESTRSGTLPAARYGTVVKPTLRVQSLSRTPLAGIRQGSNLLSKEVNISMATRNALSARLS